MKMPWRVKRWWLRRQQPKWNRKPLWTDDQGVSVYPAALADPIIAAEARERGIDAT